METTTQRKSEKLVSIFPETLGYYFEKVGEAVEGKKPAEFGSIHVKLIAQIVQRFKGAVESRMLLDNVPGLSYTFAEIEYPLAELQAYFDAADSKMNDKDAMIFVSYTYQRIKSLKEMASSLDEDQGSTH